LAHKNSLKYATESRSLCGAGPGGGQWTILLMSRCTVRSSTALQFFWSIFSSRFENFQGPVSCYLFSLTPLPHDLILFMLRPVSNRIVCKLNMPTCVPVPFTLFIFLTAFREVLIDEWKRSLDCGNKDERGFFFEILGDIGVNRQILTLYHRECQCLLFFRVNVWFRRLHWSYILNAREGTILQL
jgi:hypothetical protein